MKRLIEKLKVYLARYDKWCDEMGLTAEKKRSCVPYKKDPSRE